MPAVRAGRSVFVDDPLVSGAWTWGTVLSIPRVGQVHVFYLAALQSEAFNPGPETLEARLFTEAEVPWDELAFLTVRETLLRYFEDRRRGHFGMHDIDIPWPPR